MQFFRQKVSTKLSLLLLLVSGASFAASSTVDLGGGGIPETQKGTPNGVATLDGAGLVPVSQLPGGGGGGSVTNVSGTAPISVTNPTTTPNLSMPAATNAVDGYLTSVDHTAFSAKESALTFSAPLSRSVNVVSCIVATGSVAGCLAPADFTNFSSKEPGITAGTTLQYWRGDKSFQTLDTGAVPENGNLYYTTTRFNTNFSGKTTTDLAEGSNLYFTEARVRSTPITGFVSGAGAVAATDTVLQAIEKLDGNATDGLATKWSKAGDAGTGGTGVVGTTDAQPFNLRANNVDVMTVLASHRGVIANNPILPVDATAVDQYSFQTAVNPTSSTTGANHASLKSSLEWDGLASGFGNSGGSLISSSNAFTHSGAGTINYASTNTNSASFNSTGTTTQFKGVTSENSIASGATVTDYSGIVSGVNTTGGIVPASMSLSMYGNFTDATIGNATGVNSNLTFSGTTANSQGVNGVSSYLQFNDSTTTTNGANGVSSGIDLNNTSAVTGVTGVNFYSNVRDSATHGGMTLFNAGLNQEGSSVNPNGVNGFNANLAFSDTSDTSGVNIFNGYVNTLDTAHLDSLTGINLNPEIQGSSDVDNITMGSFSGQIRGSSTVDNLTGVTVNPQMSGSAAVTNFTGLNVSPQVNGTSTLTNGLTAVQVSPQAAVALSGANGVTIDMSGLSLTSGALAAGAQKTGLSINDGALSSGYTYTVPGAASFFQTNYLGGTENVANGDPTSAFGFGNNFAHTVTLHDDWNLDASGLGFVNVGFVGALNFDTGTTMARWTGALGGAGNPGGAGTLTDAIMFRGAGILPQGGTLTVTNMYGFQVDPNLFCIIGTNCWGFYEDTAAAENHLSKLAIGTTSKKVTNTSTALEIGNNKAFLNGRGTTAQKTALTAVAGMQFFDTDLSLLQWYDGSAWINAGAGGGGTVTAVTASAPLASSGGSTPDISIPVATASADGYLAQADWSTFNSKQPAGSYITALTGDVTASGPGSAAATIAASAVTNSKLADMADQTFKGNVSGITAAPSDLSVAQVKTALSLAGSNSGDVTLTAVGAVPNANGASLSGQALTLQPANATNPGVVTSGTQTIGGAKTFSDDLTVGANINFTPVVNNSLTGANARIPSHSTSNIVFTNASLTSIASANNGGVVGGHTLQLINETGAAITLVNNSGGAAAGEAIFTGTTADLVIPFHGSFWLQYDATASAWVSISSGLTDLASSQVYNTLPQAKVANLTTDLAAKADAKWAVVNGGNAAYSILAGDRYVRSGTTLTANRAYTLPACAGGNVGEVHDIKNLVSQTFNVILTPDGSDLIEGAATITLNPGDSSSVICAAAGAWDVR